MTANPNCLVRKSCKQLLLVAADGQRCENNLWAVDVQTLSVRTAEHHSTKHDG